MVDFQSLRFKIIFFEINAKSYLQNIIFIIKILDTNNLTYKQNQY